MTLSLVTAFTRTFIYSTLLTVLIGVAALFVFRYFASEHTVDYHAQSMIAKYQLVEQNIDATQIQYPFNVFVETKPDFLAEPLPYYWNKLKQEIGRNLTQQIDLKHSFREGEIYIWFRSISRPEAVDRNTTFT